MADKTTAIQVREPTTPGDLLRISVEKGDVATAEKLMELQERWEKSQARKAWYAAMAAFKAACPSIAVKDATVDFTSSKGRTFYHHASLAGIVALVTPHLSANGLSVSWSVEQPERGVLVTCRVAHVLGHVEAVTIGGPKDDSGNKNPLQAINSAVTYLQRYTIVAALGLATGEDDDAQDAYPRNDYQAPPPPKAQRQTKKQAGREGAQGRLRSDKKEPPAPAPQAKTSDADEADTIRAAMADAETMDELKKIAAAAQALPPGAAREALRLFYAERRIEILRNEHRDDTPPPSDEP